MPGRAVWIDEPGVLRVRPADTPDPGPGQALVRVAYAGICGSDREVLAGTRPHPYVSYPVVPGHEWSGTVAAVGSGVDDGLVGCPVVGEGIRPCGTCAACRRGDGNLCEGPYAETGFTEPGAFSDHLVLPARLLHTLPPGTDLRGAACLEPAACVAAAALRADVRPGERAAVVGGGMLGLLAVQFLHAAGAAEVLVVERSAGRAELASRCGAAELVPPEAAADRAESFDVVIEAAGAGDAATLAVRLARRGGRVVLAGIPGTGAVPLDPAALVLKQLEVHTVFGAPSRAWTHAVRAYAAGAIDPACLVGRECGLDDAESAFRAELAPDAVKSLLVP